MKAGGKLGTTQSTIYTANRKMAVSIFLVNTASIDSGIVANVVLYMGDGTNWYEFFKAPINPSSTVQLTGIALDANDSIAGVCDIANTVSVVITGMEAM